MKAQKIGTVNMGTCKLENVLYVPDLKSNLLSVSAITKRGGNIEFHKEIVKICKDGREIIK